MEDSIYNIYQSIQPTVMYFRLTNSLATFQAMMNDLFRDLINQGDMATFIDDILVAMDMEEGHDELVEEVQKFIEDQLRKGYIQPSKSPQTSPVHFVAKKDGTWRMVQDY